MVYYFYYYCNYCHKSEDLKLPYKSAEKNTNDGITCWIHEYTRPTFRNSNVKYPCKKECVVRILTDMDDKEHVIIHEFKKIEMNK